MPARVTRKDRQTVWIGPDIRITVCYASQRGGGVSLVIDAPRELQIDKEERLDPEDLEARLTRELSKKP